MGPLVSALLLAVGVYASVTAFRLGVWDWGGPGAGLFPLAFGGLLALLCAADLFRSVRRPAAGVQDDAESGPDIRSARFLAYVGALLFYVVTFALLGFLISTVLAFALLLLVGERARPHQAAAVVLGALAFGYVLMEWMLGVPLPSVPFG